MDEKQQPARKRLEGLIDEPPISFYPSLAKRTGPNKALILQEIHFLCTVKRQAQSEFGFHDGRWWVYNTYEQWSDRYFPWLSTSTVKRVFQELEICGVLLSRSYEGDQRTKWYAINDSGWDEWFNRSSDDDKKMIDEHKNRIKMIRNYGSKRSDSDKKADQNDPQNSDQNDPVLSLEADQNDPQLPIYKESEDSLTEDSATEDSSTSTGAAGEFATDPTAPDDDEIKTLILPEIKKLQFPGDLQVKLLARGYDYALATARAAQNGKNPGGLARHMMDNGGPPAELLDWARKAIELRTLDQKVIDDALVAGNTGSDIDMSRPDDPPHESLYRVLPDGKTVWDHCRDALMSVQWDPRWNDENTLRDLAELKFIRFDEQDGLIVEGYSWGAFEYHLNNLREVPIPVNSVPDTQGSIWNQKKGEEPADDGPPDYMAQYREQITAAIERCKKILRLPDFDVTSIAPGKIVIQKNGESTISTITSQQIGGVFAKFLQYTPLCFGVPFEVIINDATEVQA